MNPAARPRGYTGATHKLDSFEGFEISAKALEQAAIDQAFTELANGNNTVPPPPNPFVFDNTKAKVETVDNRTGSVVIDGSFVCDKTQEGQFSGANADLTLDAKGTGAGKFP
jgi:hypothetical protein